MSDNDAQRAQLIQTLEKVGSTLQSKGFETAAAHVRDAAASIAALPPGMDLGFARDW
jgi:hypothetical protein